MTKVDWKPWPKEKPKKNGFYLVTVDKETMGLRIVCYVKLHDLWLGPYEQSILAWAELPEPYRGETNEVK